MVSSFSVLDRFVVVGLVRVVVVQLFHVLGG